MHNKQMLWLSFLATAGIITGTTPANANQSDTSGMQTTSPSSVSINGAGGNGFTVPNIETINFGSGGGGSFGIGSGGTLGSTSGSGSAVDFTIGSDGTTTGTGSGDSSGLGEPTIRTNTGSDSGDGSSVAIDKKTLDEPEQITLNEAAEILESNLEQSVEILVAAKRAANSANDLEIDSAGNPGVATADKPQGDNPRRIARNNARRNVLDEDIRRIVRSSSGVSGCSRVCADENRPTFKTRQVNTLKVAEARQLVERQLEQSKMFIEQVNEIQPEKNIW